MDNINNHICNNTHRAIERNACSRHDTVRNLTDDMLCHENVEENMCNSCEIRCKNEHGGHPYILNVSKTAYGNKNFRESIWTGKHLQMTLMSIPRGSDIGVEVHEYTDQYIRVEHGFAEVLLGDGRDSLTVKHKLYTGDAIFIPAGTWHNIVNLGRCDLKLSSVYAPPHHPRCTVQKNK